MQVNPVDFSVLKTLQIGNVPKHLAKLDPTYAAEDKYSTNYRMRVCDETNFKTDAQDSSVLYFIPKIVDEEFPFFFSIKLADGTISPSRKMALQPINSDTFSFGN